MNKSFTFAGRKHSESTKFKISQKNYGRVTHSKIKDSDLPKIIELKNSGKTYKEIGLLYEVCPQTISNRIKYASEAKYRR